jgi:hypothetical protein
MDYARNRKYFKKPNVLPLVGIIAGIVLIISEQPIGGVVLLVASIGFLFVLARGMPSDSEIDQQVTSEMDKLHGTALNKHGLSTDQADRVSPLILGGYMSDMLGDNVKSLAGGSQKIWESRRLQRLALALSKVALFQVFCTKKGKMAEFVRPPQSLPFSFSLKIKCSFIHGNFP